MTWLAEYQLFCFQGLRHKLSPVYSLVPHECCDYSIRWIKLYKTGTAIQSNTLSHRYPLIKTKFIIIAFHLQQPIAAAQREILHVFCHTAFTSFTIYGLFVSVLTCFQLAGTRSVPFSFFFLVILTVHTLCNLPVLLAHFRNPSTSPSTWTKLSPW